jgi:hypothetical protein
MTYVTEREVMYVTAPNQCFISPFLSIFLYFIGTDADNQSNMPVVN